MNDIQILIDRQIGFCNRFSYDNILKRLVVNNGDSFYGLQSSNVVANLDEDPPIFACRFAETGGYEHILALANEDGRVGLQNTSKSQDVNTVEGFQCHNNAVFDLAWMPQSMKFVTVSGDHTAVLWSVESGAPQKLQVFSAHTRSVKTVAFRPAQAAAFATGGRDGHVLLWDARQPRQSRPALTLAPDDRLLRCHSGPARASSAHKRMRPDDYRATSITGLVFQDDNTLISCGECDGSIKVWDLRKNYNIYKREPLPKHSIPYGGSSAKNGYTNLLVDDARLRLYASCMDSVLYCYNISTYNPLPERRYVGHENNTFYIKTCLSPDGEYLVSGSSDRHAYVWALQRARPIVRLAGHRAEVTCAAWCRRGATKLVTCSDDARHKIWTLGRELYGADEEAQLQGRAETVPLADVADLPPWGAAERSPRGPRVATPGGTSTRKRPRPHAPPNKSKRCLIDMMNATRDEHPADAAAKRIKMELPSLCAAEEALADSNKRSADHMFSSPSKRLRPDKENASWYSPRAGSSFMTPTKNYEKKSPKLLSPGRSPSPKVVTFTTPTKNLPDFVSSGEAPHLRLMSPIKKKECTNWLSAMCRERRIPATGGTREPPMRTPPRPPAQTNTLLKYFNKDK